MANQRAIGIDLGTTNSVAAWIDDAGRSEIVPNAEGDLLTPSVVLFDDSEIVVGKPARSASTIHPELVAEWVKRDMGARAYSRAIRGEYLPPEVIQSCILRKLRADVADRLGPEGSVVITVPAYFDEPRRKATADAGEMAGLNVLDIVNEPTAAALAFGEIHGYLTDRGEVREEMTVLVYDLGGGTFDVTLLKLSAGDVRTLATDGDVQLGGHDWDLRLVDYVAQEFKRREGVDPRDDPSAFRRLYGLAEEAKHTLSARTRTSIRVDFGGKSSDVEITRDKFEELTADLLERTAHTTRALVRAAGLDWRDVSRLLLVGGATRMPMVVRMLYDQTGLEPDRTVNPDEAVARGAAIYAGYLLAQGDETRPGPDFLVTNVNAHGLGVEGIEPETMRKTNVVLIPRNTPLPARFTERFTTKREGQRSIVVQVLEGESSLPDECTPIARTVIRDLPPDLPQGWPIEVTFEYGTNGRLSVKAVVPGKEREVLLELAVERDSGLSEEQVARWKESVSTADADGFDVFESMIDDVLGLDGLEGDEVPASTQAPPSITSPSWSVVREESNRGTPSAGEDSAAARMPASEPDSRRSDDSRATPRQPGPDADPGGDAESIDFQPVSSAPGSDNRWLFFVVGYVSSAVIGLGLGYLLVSWLFPEVGLPRLW
jgi:molecular chaperone DnaK